MAMDTVGYEFQPGSDREYRRRLNAGNTPLSHEALQILSLRLPQILAGRPVSSSDLLRARMQPGRAGAPRPPGAGPGHPASALAELLSGALRRSPSITPGWLPGDDFSPSPTPEPSPELPGFDPGGPSPRPGGGGRDVPPEPESPTWQTGPRGPRFRTY